jgi:hypothetical protein
MGTPPGQIPQHLPHLTLARVFDALSYFSDHGQEMAHFFERNQVPADLIDPRVKAVSDLFIHP